jgi:hypothetical protein
MRNNPVLVKDWRDVLGQVVVKKVEVKRADVEVPRPTTPLEARMVGKKLWAEYCLLVTPLKGAKR